MNDTVQTWHYGLMARHWAENNTTGPEITYFQQQIEKYGQPALDAGCGTGRLLIPFLRAGPDVDGCDVSGDMLAYCQQTSEREHRRVCIGRRFTSSICRAATRRLLPAVCLASASAASRTL
jgi:SAM-dependent methyltransferase